MSLKEFEYIATSETSGKIYKDGKFIGCYSSHKGIPTGEERILLTEKIATIISKSSPIEDFIQNEDTSDFLNIIEFNESEYLNKKQPNFHEQKNKYRFMNK